ncbi:MAG: hypothetical protein NWR36_00885 [Opitutales bacterium]|jgi:Zn-dependent protease with chaperone function|nr:hypothetical protein [Opitutales bacterium]
MSIPATTLAEAKAILELTNNDLLAALNVAQKQLDVIYTRAQVLLSLAGMVVTVTGFSGRLIAGSSLMAQIFLVAGLFVSLSSAIWVFLRVMRVRWVTAMVAEDKENALAQALERRDNKTRAYAVGGTILCIGLVLYCISIALMLVDPVAVAGPVR